MKNKSSHPTTRRRRAVFIDRDGTLLKERHFLTDPRRVRFYRNAARGINLLRRSGYLVVVVSNQSGIARGLLTEARLREIHSTIRTRLAKQNAGIDGFYYCPHLPPEELEATRREEPSSRRPAAEDYEARHARTSRIGRRAADSPTAPLPVPKFLVKCKCRKPAPGLILRAAREMKIDLKKSFLIGDSLRDIQAGKSAGVKTLLVLTGNGKKTAAWLREQPARIRPDRIVRDLRSAARRIVEEMD